MLLRITGLQRQVMISSCLYMGQMLSGFSGTWAGIVIPKLRDPDQSPLPYLLTEIQLTLIGTIVFPGGMLGPHICAWLSNTRGRKPCLIIGGLMSAVGYFILVISKHLVVIFISRFIIGLSVGVVIVVNLVYIGEIASPNIRGILLTGTGMSGTFGILLAYIVGPQVSYYGSTYVGLALSVVYLIGLSWIPETPMFYTIQGRQDQVVKSLADLGRSEDIAEIIKMEKESSEINTKKDWKELFTNRSNRKALFIVVTMYSLQSCSGLYSVLFFAASIFHMAGSSVDSSLAMIIVTCFQLLGSFIAPLFVETTGRKKILLISCIVCCLCMFSLGLHFYLDSIKNPFVENTRWLPLVSLTLFFVSYDSGLGVIPNVLTGEMFTSNVRSKGSSVTVTVAFLSAFLVTTAVGALLDIVGGHVVFWFFAVVCACAFVFTIHFIPETKRRTLTEIQDNL